MQEDGTSMSSALPLVYSLADSNSTSEDSTKLEKELDQGRSSSKDWLPKLQMLDSDSQIELWRESATSEHAHEGERLATRLYRACLDSSTCLLQHLRAPIMSKREMNILRRNQALLKLWGDDHGVQEGRLDQILDSSKSVQQMTLSVLNHLCKALLNGVKKYVTPLESNSASVLELTCRTAEIYSQTKWLLESLEATSDNDSDDSSDSDSGSDSDPVGSALKWNTSTKFVEDVKVYTECLIDLSAALDRPATDPIHEDEPSVPRIEQRTAHDYHSELIRAKYPQASSALVECLGKTSWNRYHRLQKLRESIVDMEMHGEIQAQSVAKSQVANSEFKDSGLGTSIPAAPSISYAETVISFMSSVAGGSRVRIPPLSAEAKKGVKFECNACGKLIRATNNHDWRKHLFLDIQPYTCLYANCSFCSNPFANRQLWSSHLELDHKFGPSWDAVECPLCFQSTESGKSSILIHFARHMEDIALAALPCEVESDAESEDDDCPQSRSNHLKAEDGTKSNVVDPQTVIRPVLNETLLAQLWSQVDDASPSTKPKKREWSPAVRDYVRRAFEPAAAIPIISEDNVREKLREIILSFVERDTLDKVDWPFFPLPQELLQQEQQLDEPTFAARNAMDMYTCHLCYSQYLDWLDLLDHLNEFHDIEEVRIGRITALDRDVEFYTKPSTLAETLETTIPFKCICGVPTKKGISVACTNCQSFQHADCYYSQEESIPKHHKCKECSDEMIRRERPCDACRRRKSRCVIKEGALLCDLCEFRKQECTFVQSPLPSKSKIVDNDKKDSPKVEMVKAMTEDAEGQRDAGTVSPQTVIDLNPEAQPPAPTLFPEEPAIMALEISPEEFQCSICPNSFSTRRRFNQHVKTHKKPYSCHKCERAFALRSDLQRHLNARHRTGKLQYACKIENCDFKCSRKDNFRQHMLRHTALQESLTERRTAFYLTQSPGKSDEFNTMTTFEEPSEQVEDSALKPSRPTARDLPGPAEITQEEPVPSSPEDSYPDFQKWAFKEELLEPSASSSSQRKKSKDVSIDEPSEDELILMESTIDELSKKVTNLQEFRYEPSPGSPGSLIAFPDTKDHIPEVLACTDCSQEFTGTYRKGNLARHRRQRHKQQMNRFPCKQLGCGKIFYRSDKLRDHCRRIHAQPPRPKKRHAEEAKVDNIEQDSRIDNLHPTSPVSGINVWTKRSESLRVDR